MSVKILLGKNVSEHIIDDLSLRIAKLKEKNIIPGLAAIIVGNNPASKIYVRNKSRTFRENNCYSETFELPDYINGLGVEAFCVGFEDIILSMISKLNSAKNNP